jgi:hypothetical protein
MGSLINSIKKLIKSCDCDCDRECNAKRFKQSFKNWNSGNNHINTFIQNTQLSDHNYYGCQALEWIPYDRFCDIKYVTEGEFDKVYRANWVDGCINKWDVDNQDWIRNKPNMFVILKVLNDPASITSEFINEV